MSRHALWDVLYTDMNHYSAVQNFKSKIETLQPSLSSRKLDQADVNETIDQVKASECRKAIVAANIDIMEMYI
jgi:hypothetical protein